MPKGYPSLTSEQREEVIRRIKENGETVQNIAQEYGTHTRNIYNMLRKSAQTPNVALELAKLKKEHEALLKIIGQLVVKNKLGKKI
jgi:transposase-like protein